MSKLKLGLSGHFKFEVTRDGEKRTVAEFENLILNGGLDQLADVANPLTYCRVGTGSAAPLPTDTVLVNQIASTFDTWTAASGAQTTAPYYGYLRRGYRFAAGVATGNISEVGIGPGSTGQLFARALVKDAQGNPTTITVLSDEVLDVTYELRAYPPLTDAVFNVSISGTTHACRMRAGAVTSGSWSPVAGQNMAINSAHVTDGPIGPITGSATGNPNYAGPALTNHPYVPGSYTRSFNMTFPLNAANLAAGIKSMNIYFRVGQFQCEFDPVIQKDATEVLSLNGSITWARRP